MSDSTSSKFLSIFSPEGKLHQIENTYNAVKNYGLTTVAIRGTDSVVVCAEKKVPDKLIVKDSVTNIFKITDTIGVIVTGSVTDAKSLITQYRMMAAEYKFKYGYHIPVHVLASRASERNQFATQFVGIRSMRCVFTFVGIDEEKGPQVFKVDPSGFCVGYKAIAAGTKEQDAINYLEKQYKKKKEGWSRDEAIQTAIMCLQNVISTDFKSNELEIGIATADDIFFRTLTEEEIEHHLNTIADMN
jgi:20S proteasome subunit alpha 1